MSRSPRTARCALPVVLAFIPALAAAFTPGNILVSGGFSNRVIREYTTAGALVQEIPVPAHPSGEQLRDLVLDEGGVLHVYHGTFSPLLRGYTGSWSQVHTLPGWSTVNNISYGGIAATAGFVFVTDMDTFGNPEQGIVRFDTNAGFAAVRFAEAEEYIDLTIGLDCRLYALRSNSVSTQTVDVFDPITMASLGSVVLSIGGSPMDLRAIAVAADGEVFAGAWDRNIYRFDAGGALLDSLATGGLLSDINLDADGDIVAAQWLGELVLTDTSLASFTTFDPGLSNFFVAWVDGEQPPSCASCARSKDLTAGQWELVSLPCDVGAGDTLEEVFGDDLEPLDFATTWAAFQRDEAAGAYVWLNLTDPLNEGEGYWIITLDPGQSLTVEGDGNGVIDVPLFSDVADGVQNMVGHPFDIDVCWADVQVVDGASVLSLDQADPLIGPLRACDLVPPDPSCVMSRVAHTWNGSAYDAFDGVTSGMQGSLEPMDGLWVKAFKPGIALRIPQTPGSGCTFCFPQPAADAGPDTTLCLGDTATLGTAAQPGHTYSWSPGGATTAQIDVAPPQTTIYTRTVTTLCRSAQDLVAVVVDDGSGSACSGGVRSFAAAPPVAAASLDARSQGNDPRNWTVRLVAESGKMRDAGNVLGQAPDARDGFDYHDLKEQPPFGERYLSIVFPHGDWQEHSGDYTSDFHAPHPPRQGEWHFDVIAGELRAPVTLRWAGEGMPLRGMFLIDRGTGQRIRVQPFGSYTFDMGTGGRRSFLWMHGQKPR